MTSGVYKIAAKILCIILVLGLLVLYRQEVARLKVELKDAQQNVAQLTAVNQANQQQIAAVLATQQRVNAQSDTLVTFDDKLHLIATHAQQSVVCHQTADKTMTSALDQIRAAQQEMEH